MIHYVAGSTFDSNDMAKARELKYQETKYNSWGCLVAIFCFVITGLCITTEEGLFLIIGIITAIIGLRAINDVKIPTKDKATGCEEWFMWMKDREHRYYGNRSAWQLQALKNAMAGVFHTEKDYSWMKMYPSPSAWECDGSIVHCFTDQLLVANSDGSYDYSKLFEELAYQFLVICKRINAGEGTYCNFVENVAHQLWGVNAHDKHCVPWAGKSDFTNEFKVLQQYPISVYQMHEFTMFNYNMSDNPHGWLWDVWTRAYDRYRAELQQQQTIKPYDMNNMRMSDFRHLKNYDDYYDANPTIAAADIVRRRIVEEQYLKA